MLDPASLAKLKARDPGALSAAVREHAGPLYRAARGLGLPEVDAEELVSESFTAFLGALDRFEGRSTVRTFLFGILYRKALERGRRQARELATDPGDAVFDGRFDGRGHWTRPPRGPEQEAAVKEAAALLAECLEGLPERQRAAFQLKEVDRQSPEEIRNILGVADTHLRVLLFRARTRLRDCLEGKWGKGG